MSLRFHRLDAHSQALVPHTEVAILGAGFAGIGTAIRLEPKGCRDFIIFEKADDLGGTW